MQYNNIISVQSNIYNDFGEEKASGVAANIKCCVLKETKTLKSENKSFGRVYDLKIIVGNKTFAPYNLLATNETLFFTFETRKFKASYIDKIKDFSGKTKYLEIELEEQKDGA